MKRPCLAALAALTFFLGAPTHGGAAPILEEPDAVELAQSLAEATAEQGICYGWEIQVQDDSGGASGLEAGSSQGPGRPLDRIRCRRHAVLAGSIHYTSEYSESEDSAEVAIDSNLARPPTYAQLRGLGVDADDLVGENDDQAIIEMAGVLPLLVAEAGQAPYVPFEPQAGPIPAQDRPTDSPGSDWWRTYWWLPLMAAALGIGILFFAVKGARSRRGASPSLAADRPPSRASEPSSEGEAT